MHTIWKFPVPVSDEFKLDLPRGARFLSAQVQGSDFAVREHLRVQAWFLLDPEAPKERRKFCVIGTGHEIHGEPARPRLVHLSTFQIDGGRLVFHLFERQP